jgi:hypothetical protein
MDVGQQQQIGVGAERGIDLRTGGKDETKAEQLGDAAGDVQIGVEIAGFRQQHRPIRQPGGGDEQLEQVHRR